MLAFVLNYAVSPADALQVMFYNNSHTASWGVALSTIEKLAGLGEGQGLYNGRKIFIPYTMAGDVVEAELTLVVAPRLACPTTGQMLVN